MGRTLTRKGLVRKLDEAFSIYIRARDIKIFGCCPFCQKRPIEHCFHWLTRAKYATRWDEENAIGSCAGCNYRMEFEPAIFYQWYVRRWSQDKLDALILKSNGLAKFDNYQLEAMTAEYLTRKV